MRPETETSQIQEELYLTFSEFFKDPTLPLFEEIKSGAVDLWLEEILREGGYPAFPLSLKDSFGTFEEMEDAYARCFSGREKPFAPPVESVYKEWTKDPSSNVEISRMKGYLMGDAALHMKYLFQSAGIEVPVRYAEMPDHLSLLLEFLSLLLKEGNAGLYRSFMEDHLDWLEDFERALASIKAPAFYLEVTSLLRRCLETDRLRAS